HTYKDDPESNEIGPFFGWLSNRIRCYDEDTYCLKTMAHFRSDGQRPLIEVEPTDHPLANHQRHGISLEGGWELVHHYLLFTGSLRCAELHLGHRFAFVQRRAGI